MTASNVSLPTLLVALALCLPTSFSTGAPAAAVPELVSPKTGDTLENGVLNKNVEYTWVFEWKAVPGATDYHLVVIGDRAKISLVDTQIKELQYRFVSRGYIAPQNQKGWKWKVRAKVNDTWQPWSAQRGFAVGPLKK
jgi:hypothetical protein